jgi:hypothetical protein
MVVEFVPLFARKFALFIAENAILNTNKKMLRKVDDKNLNLQGDTG